MTALLPPVQVGGNVPLRGLVSCFALHWHGTLGNGQVSDDHSMVPVPVQELTGAGAITGGSYSAYAIVP